MHAALTHAAVKKSSALNSLKKAANAQFSLEIAKKSNNENSLEKKLAILFVLLAFINLFTWFGFFFVGRNGDCLASALGFARPGRWQRK